MKIVFFLILSIIPYNITAQPNDSLFYLFPDFQNATVKLTSGKSETAVMNYNVISEQMIFFRNEKILALNDLGTIEAIYLGERIFIPAKDKFFELFFDAPVPLFIEHRRNLESNGKPAPFGGKTHLSAVNSYSSLTGNGYLYDLKPADNLKVSDASVYWVWVNRRWRSFASETQFLRIFHRQKHELKQFLQSGSLDVNKKEDLRVIMRFVNEMKSQNMRRA